MQRLRAPWHLRDHGTCAKMRLISVFHLELRDLRMDHVRSQASQVVLVHVLVDAGPVRVVAQEDVQVTEDLVIRLLRLLQVHALGGLCVADGSLRAVPAFEVSYCELSSTRQGPKA
jgi:hypothetical protein